MKFFAAAYTSYVCTGRPTCGSWSVRSGYCKHPKDSRVKLRFYDTIGPAKAFVTMKKKGGQTQEQTYVLVGDIADMIRPDADAQARYEHEERRSVAHGEAAVEALRDASEPPRKSRRKRVA